ncbi:MAG: hypothetical protein Q7S30_03400 [Candidatus Omnitrophota bacterium]|nr:hypothetical protein [Candidatus Omnitrophota bacterium]
MIDISRKKGFVLAIAIYFVLLVAITSIGIYSYSEHIVREASVDKGAFTRGYFSAISGARYAYILLQDPKTNFGFDGVGHLGFDGETYTLTISPGPLGSIGSDLNLTANDRVIVVIKEYDKNNPVSTPWDANSYQVNATFIS